MLWFFKLASYERTAIAGEMKEALIAASAFCFILTLCIWAWMEERKKRGRPITEEVPQGLAHTFIDKCDLAHTFFDKCVERVMFFVAAIVCAVIGLGSIAFFGYGAWLGIVMFFTLAPVSILAGLVLFLVSVLIGYWVVMVCLAGALVSWASMTCAFQPKNPPHKES